MWKIYNYIFGWNYIYWENTADSGVARIRQTANGEYYYNRYSFKKVLLPDTSCKTIYLT